MDSTCSIEWISLCKCTYKYRLIFSSPPKRTVMYTVIRENLPISHPPCKLCGGAEHRKIHCWGVGDTWNPADIELSVWQCENCGLASLFPVPDASQMPDSGDWWSSARVRRRRRRWFKVPWERFRGKVFGTPARRFVRATRRAVDRGRLLDIGCGDGRMLVEAVKYYDCVGVDPSPAAVKTARKNGFEVLESTFEDADFSPQSFDVALMDSIIEHVSDPVATLKKVNSLLRMGGVVALRTPKFGGPSYRIHGRAWNGFRHGYHSFLFSGKTLTSCLQKAGFEVLTNPRRDRGFDDILILWGRKVKAAECRESKPIHDHSHQTPAEPLVAVTVSQS